MWLNSSFLAAKSFIFVAIAALLLVGNAVFIVGAPGADADGDYVISRDINTYIVTAEGATITQSSSFATVWNYVIDLSDSDTILLVSGTTYEANDDLEAKDGLTIDGRGATVEVADNKYALLGNGTGANRNITIRNITYDFQDVGFPIFIRGTETTPAQNFLIENFNLINISDSWGLRLGYAYPNPSLPTTSNSGVIIRDGTVTSPNGSSTLENIIISNWNHGLIENVTFSDTVASKTAALAIYGLSSDIVVRNCTFAADILTESFYTHQAHDIIIEDSTIHNQYRIKESEDIIIRDNDHREQIIIEDYGFTDYDGNTKAYWATRNVLIANNTVNTTQATFVRLILNGTSYTDSRDEMPSNIRIEDNTVTSVLNSIFLNQAMHTTNDAYVDGLFIIDNTVVAHSSTLNSDVIRISGHADNLYNGWRHIVIEDNTIAATSSGGSAPYDVNIEAGFDSVFIRNNDFGNLGVNNSSGYTVSGNT